MEGPVYLYMQRLHALTDAFTHGRTVSFTVDLAVDLTHNSAVHVSITLTVDVAERRSDTVPDAVSLNVTKPGTFCNPVHVPHQCAINNSHHSTVDVAECITFGFAVAVAVGSSNIVTNQMFH